MFKPGNAVVLSDFQPFSVELCRQGRMKDLVDQGGFAC
jgi:hypothetical protein